MPQHGLTEAGRQAPVEVHAERSAATIEILVELTGAVIETSGMVQDAWADPVCKGLQDAVVVLARIGHSNQSGLGRRKQQAADPGVNGAVRDVEEALSLGGGREAVVETAEVIWLDAESSLQPAGEIGLGVHRALLSVMYRGGGAVRLPAVRM